MSLQIEKAITFAAQAHKNQTRKFDNPAYIEHLLEVKNIVSSFDMHDEEVLIAAVLHDVFEDTQVTTESISNGFGSRVLSLVEQLIEDKSSSLEERRATTIRKLVKQEEDVHAITLADLMSNLSALSTTWSSVEKNDYFQWCETLIAACDKAPAAMIRLARYLLWNQAGESKDLSTIRRWIDNGHLYWSLEKQRLLYVYFTELGSVEARMSSSHLQDLNSLFALGLLKDFKLEQERTASVLVVDSIPAKKDPNFNSYFVECELIGSRIY